MDLIWSTDFEAVDEKKSANVSAVDFSDSTMTPSDLEEALTTKQRPTLLINPIIVGLTLTLLVAALRLGCAILPNEPQLIANTRD